MFYILKRFILFKSGELCLITRIILVLNFLIRWFCLFLIIKSQSIDYKLKFNFELNEIQYSIILQIRFWIKFEIECNCI